MSLPNMISKGNQPLAVFPVNGRYVLAVYKGTLSEFDLLLKYRQKDESRGSGWTNIRTPKHIHWAVDVLLKMHSNEEETKQFLDFLITAWNEHIKPIRTEEERMNLLNVETLLKEVNKEALKYESLADKGEYSIKFLILIARLLMIQEKTNMETAFMFKQLLDALRAGQDIFKIVSIATHR
ncbi:MAG: hypothetical protein IPG18_12250 [Saprospiraceae bacterium]|nr:hypothetical protein [Saprospiraceae bacterium]MBK8370051.1 hypothetical protein [Saprospiraceae bacterium]